jgi:DNA end-binding protein Ku
MRFASELVDPEQLSFPDAELVRPQELKMAEQLVANLAEPFAPEKYTDDYRANLMKVIKAKMKGKKIEIPEDVEEKDDGKVLDLMARLQASLGQAGKGKAKGGAKPAAKAEKPAAKAPAKKAAAKKPARARKSA